MSNLANFRPRVIDSIEAFDTVATKFGCPDFTPPVYMDTGHRKYQGIPSFWLKGGYWITLNYFTHFWGVSRSHWTKEPFLP